MTVQVLVTADPKSDQLIRHLKVSSVQDQATSGMTTSNHEVNTPNSEEAKTVDPAVRKAMITDTMYDQTHSLRTTDLVLGFQLTNQTLDSAIHMIPTLDQTLDQTVHGFGMKPYRFRGLPYHLTKPNMVETSSIQNQSILNITTLTPYLTPI